MLTDKLYDWCVIWKVSSKHFIYSLQKADTEAGLFKERQMLLSELETLRSRSSQQEREHALTKNQVSLDQEKLAILQARLEERENNLKEK